MNNTETTPTATELYREIISKATPKDIEQASLWYEQAQEIAHDVANNLDTTLEVGASIVSAFSPREPWATNITKAIAFSLGHTPKGLSNNLKMAQASLVSGFNALNGAKTNAFARAIAGDTDAVVIDTWMMKAAKMPTLAPTKKQYLELSEAVTVVAQEQKITPRTAQALIWILVRGSAV